MSEGKIVWSDTEGDLRKRKNKGNGDGPVDETTLILELRRLTSGKGRVVIEIKGLPQNKKWCQKLAKDLKKSLGVGGAYKNDFIEVHGDKMEAVQNLMDQKLIKWKKTGG